MSSYIIAAKIKHCLVRSHNVFLFHHSTSSTVWMKTVDINLCHTQFMHFTLFPEVRFQDFTNYSSYCWSWDPKPFSHFMLSCWVHFSEHGGHFSNDNPRNGISHVLAFAFFWFWETLWEGFFIPFLLLHSVPTDTGCPSSRSSFWISQNRIFCLIRHFTMPSASILILCLPITNTKVYAHVQNYTGIDRWMFTVMPKVRWVQLKSVLR